MKYLSGKHALNIPSKLNMSPDWHSFDLDWSNLDIRETDDSIFDLFGIDNELLYKDIPVANQLRAILDLMEDGNIAYLYGMRNDFFLNDEYNFSFFEKVILLKNSKCWDEIDKLMLNEFMMEWVKYKKEVCENGAF